MSQQHGYAELLLLGKTIDRASDHPLNILFIDPPTSVSSSFEASLGINFSNSPTAVSSALPPYSPDSDFGVRSLGSEARSLSYVALVAQLTPEQLRARHLADVETEVAIWLGTGVIPLEIDPKNPMQKKNVNIVDFWKVSALYFPTGSIYSRLLFD